MAIVSFKDKGTQDIALGRNSRQARAVLPKELHKSALNKLTFLNAASRLEQLFALRGLRLELLKGDRKGRYSIRINDQYRICFRFADGNAADVEIVDYH